MDGTALGDDVVVGVVAVNSHQVIAGANFTPDAHGNGVVLFAIGWNKNRVINEYSVGIGAISSIVVGIISSRN